MAEYILEDWYGKEQTFDKETIYVHGKDGELMPFTHGTGDSGATLENPIVTSGTFKPTSETYTFYHNLGVVPDCIMIRNQNFNDDTVPNACILYAIGFRTGLKFSANMQDIIARTSTIQWIGHTQGIDEPGTPICEFKNANAESVTVGGVFAKMDTTAEYDFFATRILP